MKKDSLLKRAGCAATAVFLAVGLLAGCGGNQNAEGKTSQTGVSDSGQTQETAEQSKSGSADQENQNVGERITLTIATQSNPQILDFETNYFTKLLEDRLNVNLDFILLPAKEEEAKTKINLWANDAQTKLPDIIWFGFDDAMENEFGSKGMIIPVDQYLEDPELSPAFHKALSETDREYVLNSLRMLDGKIYSIPRYDPFPWNESCYRGWIDTRWLDKLNLEMPKTLDEMHDVLTAFVNQDPNGNGKKDEVGVVGSTGWGGDVAVFFLNSFLYVNPNTGYFDQKDGTVFPSFTQDKWKEGLELLNQWMNEGLIDPLSFTQDATQAKALINQIPEGMAGVVLAGSYSNFDTTILGKNSIKLMPPMKGSDGFSTTPTSPTLPVKLWHITKDCEYPELAAKLGDLFWEYDIIRSAQFGEKDVDWSMDPVVMEKYWLPDEYVKEGYELEFVQINDLYASPEPQNKTWGPNTPGGAPLLGKVETSKVLKSDATGESVYVPNIDFPKYYVPVFRPKEELIAKFSYTAEEMEEISDIKTVINDYVKTSITEFIMGTRPFSEWDSYLKELDDMGLQKLIEVNQNAYERSQQ